MCVAHVCNLDSKPNSISELQRGNCWFIRYHPTSMNVLTLRPEIISPSYKQLFSVRLLFDIVRFVRYKETQRFKHVLKTEPLG